MRANAGGLCVGDQDGVREWILVSTRECQLGWLARARKSKAGRDPLQIAPGKTGLVEALLDRGHDGNHGGLEPQPDVRRACHRIGEPST
jgi:hypothetical protein